MNDILPAWREGPSRRAIVRFVETVTSRDDPNYVPPTERVAVFDNDGTLWCEKPMYIQLDFALRRLQRAAADDASLQERQPWKAAYEEDHEWLEGAVTYYNRGDDSHIRQLLGGIMKAFEGMTVEEFDAASDEFLRSAAHPTLDRPYLECVYQPMVELVHYLGANGFVLDDGPVKPTRIWSRVGRRPILAAGNSDGDIEMLRFAKHPLRPSLSLLVYHDDAEREFAYDAGAQRSLEIARERGWTIVSMRDDWKTVYDVEQ
jgi:hypothetical protein